MAGLISLRETLRLDLKDPSDERWADALLERHVVRALAELSRFLPHEQKSTLATVSASRDLDIASLADRVIIQAVEYPVDRYPKEFVRFSLWQDILTLLLDYAPDGSNAYVYWGKHHAALPDWAATTAYAKGDFVVPTTLTGFRYECTTAGTSDGTEPSPWGTTLDATTADNTVVWTCRAETFSPQWDDLIILGASAFALLEWANFTVNQVNLGGLATAREYQAEGVRRLNAFHAELKQLGRQNRVRVRTLYAPYHPIVSKTIVTGP